MLAMKQKLYSQLQKSGDVDKKLTEPLHDFEFIEF